MMNVCLAAAVLSLLAVGQSAPLACEKLEEPMEKFPDTMTETWYVIGISHHDTLWTFMRTYIVLMTLSPSMSVDITARALNSYDLTWKMKKNGFCYNLTSSMSYVDGFLLDGSPVAILHTGCPDCLVMKERNLLTLLSRRRSVTVGEMMEFKKQAECDGQNRWSEPIVFNTDNDTVNCRTGPPSLSDAELKEIIASFPTKLCRLISEMVTYLLSIF